MRGRRRAAIAGAMRRAPPWGRRTPHRGSRPGVRAGGRRRGLPPARDVVRAPRLAPPAGGARRGGVACRGCGRRAQRPARPARTLPGLRQPDAPAHRAAPLPGRRSGPGLARPGPLRPVRRRRPRPFRVRPLPSRSPLAIATLVDLLGRDARGGRTRSGRQGHFASAVNQRHKLRLEIIKLIAAIAGNSRGSRIAAVRQSDHRHPAQ